MAEPPLEILIGIVMGSESDYPTMKQAAEVLADFHIPCEVRVVSAHRTPDEMFEYARSARDRGLRVIVAGAGGAAHLPGMIASLTTLPVIGVPIQTKALQGMDSVFSILQMPGGIPVATVSIGGGKNAGLLAARILGATDPVIAERLAQYTEDLRREVAEMNRHLAEQ